MCWECLDGKGLAERDLVEMLQNARAIERLAMLDRRKHRINYDQVRLDCEKGKGKWMDCEDGFEDPRITIARDALSIARKAEFNAKLNRMKATIALDQHTIKTMEKRGY